MSFNDNFLCDAVGLTDNKFLIELKVPGGSNPTHGIFSCSSEEHLSVSSGFSKLVISFRRIKDGSHFWGYKKLIQ